MSTFDPTQPSQGLGDSIAKITHALGMDKLADKVAELLGEEDCGCEKRREALNNLVSYETTVPKEDYLFTDSRPFRVLAELTVNTTDPATVYNPGDIVMVQPGHILYPGLKPLLKQKYIEKYNLQNT